MIKRNMKNKEINCHIIIYGKIKCEPAIIYGKVIKSERTYAKMYGAKIYKAKIIYNER